MYVYTRRIQKRKCFIIFKMLYNVKNESDPFIKIIRFNGNIKKIKSIIR